ncbi:MAG: hypothetical protein ACTHK7_08165 [Aureliella sp.]
MRKTEASERRLSALWCALGYAAKKRGDRDFVGDGTSTKVDVEITGRVGPYPVSDELVGVLDIGKTQTTETTAAAPAELVVALLLDELGSDDRQARFMARLVEHVSRHNCLPETDPATATRASNFLKCLRTKSEKPKRGDLVFVLKAVAALFLAILFTGCAVEPPRPLTRPRPPPPAEVPVVDLPAVLREWNWTDRNGSGSCVHASSVYHFRWQNQLELAAWWRQTHAGGETASSIQSYWRQAGIRYSCTENGDPAFLEWATRTRRGAIIWFFPSHCVHFCGFSTVDGQSYALLCDNNRIEKYIRVPREEFLRRWKEYGGFACTALFAPAPPLPWQCYEVVE